MAVTYNSGTRVVTVNNTSPPNNAADVTTAVADTARADTVISESGTRLYVWDDITFDITTGGQLIQDEAAIILHTLDSASQAFSFADATSILQFGHLDESSPGLSADAPVTSENMGDDGEAGFLSACQYSFACNNASQTWAGGDTGTFRMYGGLLRFWNNSTTRATYSADLPTATEMIQVNVENWSGGTFTGTGYRVQECTLKSSAQAAFVPSGSSTARLQDIIFHDCDEAFDISGLSSTTTFRRVGLRGNTTDLLGGTAFTGDLTLVDSDSIATVSSLSFSGGGQVTEANSYNFKFRNPDGTTTGLTSIRSLVYRTTSGGSEAYGAEQTGADPSERIANRYRYDSTHTTVVGRLEFGNASIRVRLYDKKFLDVEKTLGEFGLTDTFVIEDNPNTVLTSVAALALTGIAIDEGNSEIDLTVLRTPSEIYDFLQATQAGANEMDLPELLSTNDGNSYTLASGWTFTGLEFLDLSGGEVILNAFVPITITGISSGVRVAVVDVDQSPDVSLASATATATSITLATPFVASTQISIRARLKGNKPFAVSTTISPSGQTVAADLIPDTVFT